MEILSTRPRLSIEARHTISLEVAKQRRLRVPTSLFIPRKNTKPNQSAQEDDMNPQAPGSSEGLKMLPWYGSGEGSTPRDSDSSDSSSNSPKPHKITEKSVCSAQNMVFGRPYDPRLSLTASGNHFVRPHKYTAPIAGRFPPMQAQESAKKCDSKKSPRSQSCSRILSEQQNAFQSQQALSRLVGQFATPPPGTSSASVGNKSQAPCFFAESTSEQIVRATSAPTLQSFSATFGMLNDARFANASAPPVSQESANTCQQSCQDISTQTRKPSVSPASSFGMYSEETVTYTPPTAVSSAPIVPQIAAPLNQSQQTVWQIPSPTPEPPRTLLNPSAIPNVAANTFIPEPSVVTTPAPVQPPPQAPAQAQGQAPPQSHGPTPSQINYANLLKNMGFQGPPNRLQMHESGAPRPAPAPTPSQINYANLLKNMSLQGTHNRLQMHEAGPPKPNAYLPPNENLRLLSELCQAKRMSEFQAADSDNKKPPAKRATKSTGRAPRKPAAKRQSAKKNNLSPPPPTPHGCVQQVTYIICPPGGNQNLEIFPFYGQPQEVRYRPYQCMGPPAIMYHQPMVPAQPPSAPEALPASLAPADMARWLASRYQQPTPQPQRDYNAMERELSDLQQALVRYSSPRPPPPPPPSQNNQNFMKSFCEQYTEAVQTGRFFNNPSQQTSSCCQDNRSPNRNYALPKMMDSGQSNCGPQQNYYTGPRPLMMNAPPSAPMYGMGHPQQARRVHYGPVAPPPGVRFQNYNQKPMDSGRVPSTISPAMGGLSISEQVPGEFYRNMVNLPEYDPRDNR